MVNPDLYDISYIQFLPARPSSRVYRWRDQRSPGRRCWRLRPCTRSAADNPTDTNAFVSGTLKLADDGSLAALVPARRAITHHLLGTNYESVVKERYWITYQPGEIRTCKNCHGINTVDQAGQTPNNPPQALRDLLRYWKTQNTPVVAVQNNNGTPYLNLTFKRRAGVSNVTHTVELSGDLNAWQSGSAYSATNSDSKHGRHSRGESNWRTDRDYHSPEHHPGFRCPQPVHAGKSDFAVAHRMRRALGASVFTPTPVCGGLAHRTGGASRNPVLTSEVWGAVCGCTPVRRPGRYFPCRFREIVVTLGCKSCDVVVVVPGSSLGSFRCAGI